MIQVLEKIYVYVPSTDVEREFKIPNEGGSESATKVDDKKFTMLLVGGDQLTVARICGVQMICGNSETSEQQFEGLLPVAEDWHAKMCFLEVRIFLHQAVKSLLSPSSKCIATCSCTAAAHALSKRMDQKEDCCEYHSVQVHMFYTS